MEKELLTAREVAGLLSLSLDYVYRLYQRGVLPGRKLGPRSLRFVRQDVETFAQGIESTLPPARLGEALTLFAQEARQRLDRLRWEGERLQTRAAEEQSLRHATIAAYVETVRDTQREITRALARLERCAQSGTEGTNHAEP